MTRIAVCAACLLLSGCAGLGWDRHVKNAASSDLDCPKEEIEVTKEGAGGIWLAEGCSNSGRYRCSTTAAGAPHCKPAN